MTSSLSRRFLSPCATALVAFALLLATVPVFANQEEMAKLQRDIEALQKELKSVQGTRTELQKEVEKSEKDINELQKKADKINQELKQQQQELNKLEHERAALERQQQAQLAQLTEQVRASHRLGQQSELKVLFNQESPGDFARIMKYHSYFMAAHNQKLAGYRETIAQIDNLTPAIVQRTDELRGLQEQLDRQRNQLKKLHGQRQSALAKVNHSLKDKQEALRQAVQDRNRLQALMNQVAKRVAGAAQSPAYVPLPPGGERFSKRKGRMPWPTQGSMIHRFGSARIAGQINWSGAYISAPAGNSVVAVHHGRVVFADYFGGHGLLIIVDHGEGYMSLYAHNQELLKKAGELVSAGDTIARVGNSGGQSSNGLYFEIRYQGKPIDPGAWLARG
ncbi:murein hydrolase activator EnvC family protein [Cellvibrio japonicus]|nr:peptidoglycan DD-metalloendopeptidase family protein [Cellvibrio japonicus]QEI13765.1 peptidoglycan DD-metalloendopeptidase family protein [Cellvibrio japonicus]QEI17339.1 peptidoglycan DD-metalloendopeptidase family protein [Cellvibrio japonicus]QEI20916.1 peptidoglycan DD-metalloendopeptidase family protein [Cellvibrio japonicus]